MDVNSHKLSRKRAQGMVSMVDSSTARLRKGKKYTQIRFFSKIDRNIDFERCARQAILPSIKEPWQIWVWNCQLQIAVINI